MEAITYLAALTLAMSGGSGKSPAATALVGTWRVQVSQEVRDVARKMGLPEPQALLVFKEDNTFSYTSPGKSFNGTYEVSDSKVKLLSSGSSLGGELKSNNSELDMDGMKYSKGNVQGLVGTWVLRSGSNEDANTRIVFKADGSFVFNGNFASSKGKYSVDGDSVRLEWSEIDNEKVAAGTVHKTFPLNADGSLQIDSFRYVKQ